MEASRYQTSAAVLSLSHCMLTWHFADSTKKDEEMKKKTHSIIDIYRRMRLLRLAIQGIETESKDTIISIPEMAKPFNSIVSGMPEETWIGVVSSLMQEVASMKDVLKDITKCSTKDGLLYDNVLDDDSQPKHLIFLLTLWYWLAVWFDPNEPEISGAKDEFIQAMEAHHKTLGFLLVDTSPIHPSEKQELQVLFSKLFQMLKSDPQLWAGILDHFADRMVNLGKIRRQVKTLLYTPAALNDDSSLQHKSGAIETLVMPPLHTRSLVSTIWKIAKKVVPGLAAEAALRIGEMIYDAVAGKNFVMVAPDDIGPEAKLLAQKVANDDDNLKEKIHDEVKQLAKMVGEGAEHLA